MRASVNTPPPPHVPISGQSACAVSQGGRLSAVYVGVGPLNFAAKYTHHAPSGDTSQRSG